MKESDLNSVKFTFHVTDDGSVVDLTGTTCRLAVAKPSGLTVFQDCTITDPVSGICEIVLTNQAYIEIGNYTAELVIILGDITTITRSFSYTSLNAILDEGSLESQNDWQSFQDLLLNTDLRPILGTGSPNGIKTPEYLGQTYLDTMAMTMYYASTLLNDGWLTFGTGGGQQAGSVYWTDVLNKPTTFTPSAHTHLWADLTDKPTEFPPVAHTHDWATGITNKPDTFPPSAHTHPEYLTQLESDVLYQAINTVPVHTHVWADIIDKPTTFTPPVATGAALGGVIVGNGLRMTGSYLTIRDGLGIKTNTGTSQLDVDKAAMDTWYARTTQNLIVWKGTQAEYDAIGTKDATTLYFIT